MDLKTAIRTIPDYPKPGIMFRDITTLLGDARAFRRAVDELVQPFAGQKIDKVAGIGLHQLIDCGAEGPRMPEQGGDVAEHDPRFRVVRDGADDRREIHLPSSRSTLAPQAWP